MWASFVNVFCVLILEIVIGNSISHLTEKDILSWDENEVGKWLKKAKISDDGIEYILDEMKLNDGEQLLYLRYEEKHKETLISKLKFSDKSKFKDNFEELIESITIEEEQTVEEEEEDIESKSKSKEEPNEMETSLGNALKILSKHCSSNEKEEICRCISTRHTISQSKHYSEDSQRGEKSFTTPHSKEESGAGAYSEADRDSKEDRARDSKPYSEENRGEDSQASSLSKHKQHSEDGQESSLSKPHKDSQESSLSKHKQYSEDGQESALSKPHKDSQEPSLSKPHRKEESGPYSTPDRDESESDRLRSAPMMIENENEIEREIEKDETESESESESESPLEDTDTDNEKVKERLEIGYKLRDIAVKDESNELKRAITFNVSNENIDHGILLYLEWCTVKETICSEQSFSFPWAISTTILTNIEYSFEIYDEKRRYESYHLKSLTDVQPSQGQRMVLEISANVFDTPSIADFEHEMNRKLHKWSLSKTKTENNHKVYTSRDCEENDKLMAENIRKILLSKYRANNVDVSQRMDANSYGTNSYSIANDKHSWTFLNNSTLFILCFIVLCATIIVGFQKKFPFKYQSVYSMLNHDNESEATNFESISIEKYETNNESNGTKAEAEAEEETDSVQVFLQKVFKNIGTPSFITSKYIRNLKDDYISTIEQLREFDDGDWKRYGFKKNHISVIKNKLQNDEDEDEDEDDDEVSFDDEEDVWQKKVPSTDFNEEVSTTDFDDF